MLKVALATKLASRQEDSNCSLSSICFQDVFQQDFIVTTIVTTIVTIVITIAIAITTVITTVIAIVIAKNFKLIAFAIISMIAFIIKDLFCYLDSLAHFVIIGLHFTGALFKLNLGSTIIIK